MNPSPAPVLVASGLTKSFGAVEALRDVSLSVSAGETVAMIGPNGAGKTTCFNVLSGQLRADAGTIALLGERIERLPPRAIARRGVGRTFQVAATFASMTVRENVQMALIAHAGEERRVDARAAALHRAEADALLERVGLPAVAEQSCGTLSYGDTKRIELALALANAPRLLLMDEPTAGMPMALRTAVMRLAVERAREKGIAVLFTEHDMDVVFAHADRILVLDRGQVIAEGAPKAVAGDPRVRDAYLGCG
ncbi:MAG TPA: ABC transporter ATP-binding protein [Casimicrobiaceae bacterium]|nr:ABC transporter ATP-binding protein [Casimicrobiaceae bacterium]